MAFRIDVSGSYKERGKEAVQLSREVSIDSRIIDRKQAYDLAIVRLIEDNELGLSSGVHIFKDMVITIT